MDIYHGTGLINFEKIEADGFIKEGSYFGDLEIAIEYASSFGEGIILKSSLNVDNFAANTLLNMMEYENGDVDNILDPSDLMESINLYNSVVSVDKIYDYRTISIEQAKKLFNDNIKNNNKKLKI
jgi:hypothetical protein